MPQNYLYNGGAELRTDLGLNTYETLFRMYDPAMGRFWQPDPLADFSAGINPYSFGFNNPIDFNDPYGLTPEWYGKLRAFINLVGKRLSGQGGPGVWTNKAGTGTWSTGSNGNGIKPNVPTPRQIAKKYDKPNDDRPGPAEDIIRIVGQLQAHGPSLAGGPTLTHYAPPTPSRGFQNIDDDGDKAGGKSEDNPLFNKPFNEEIHFEKMSAHITDSALNDIIINQLVQLLLNNPGAHLTIIGNAFNPRLNLNGLMMDRARAVRGALRLKGVPRTQLDDAQIGVNGPPGRRTTFILHK